MRVCVFGVHCRLVIKVSLPAKFNFARLSLFKLRFDKTCKIPSEEINVISLSKAKDSEDAAEKRESDPSAAAASGGEETNLIDLCAAGGSADSVSNGGATVADSKEAKKIAVLEGRKIFV